MKRENNFKQFLKGTAVFLGAFALTLGAIAAIQKFTEPKPATTQTTGIAVKSVVDRTSMVWIPGGEFTMGTNDTDSQANERPARSVKVAGFWMDTHDVTNAQFRKFVEATGYKTVAERPIDWEEIKKQFPPGTLKPAAEALVPAALVFTPTKQEIDLSDVTRWWRLQPGADWRHPKGPGSSIDGMDEHPVVQVAWEDAKAYAEWAGKRLPTEAEWEFAARGGLKEQRFNWGQEFSPGEKIMCNTYTGTFPVKDTGKDGFAGTNPWNAFPPNGYGLYDMAGNVWQWTADVYTDKENCPMCVPKTDAAREALASYEFRRVIKGGSYLCTEQYCESYRPSARRGTPLDTGSDHVGFRCVSSEK
jgi:formylglycine-generating enzyme required for sulfatase activity